MHLPVLQTAGKPCKGAGAFCSGVYAVPLPSSLQLQQLPPGFLFVTSTAGLGKTVAVKEIPATAAAHSRPTAYEAAVNEARMLRHLATCSTENVVKGIAFLQDQTCCQVLTQLLPDGMTASAISSKIGTSLPVGSALVLFQQVLLGARSLHRAAVVHGDISGSNVVVVVVTGLGFGTPGAVLVDLGSAVVVGQAKQAGRRHASTPAYRAPELYADRELPPTPASDVWAATCVLCELLTGWLPHQEWLREQDRKLPGGPEQDISRGLSQGKQPISDRMYLSLPDCVRSLLDMGLQHRPADRASVQQMLEQVQVCLVHDDVSN